MKLKDFFKKGQKVRYGDREVIIQGPTKERGSRKLLLVLIPWTEEELKFRKENKLREPYDGLTSWVPEDQLKSVR